MSREGHALIVLAIVLGAVVAFGWWTAAVDGAALRRRLRSRQQDMARQEAGQ